MEALCVSLVVAVAAVVAVVGVVMYARSKKKIEEMHSAVERYELEKRAAQASAAKAASDMAAMDAAARYAFDREMAANAEVKKAIEREEAAMESEAAAKAALYQRTPLDVAGVCRILCEKGYTVDAVENDDVFFSLGQERYAIRCFAPVVTLYTGINMHPPVSAGSMPPESILRRAAEKVNRDRILGKIWFKGDVMQFYIATIANTYEDFIINFSSCIDMLNRLIDRHSYECAVITEAEKIAGADSDKNPLDQFSVKWEA